MTKGSEDAFAIAVVDPGVGFVAGDIDDAFSSDSRRCTVQGKVRVTKSLGNMGYTAKTFSYPGQYCQHF